MAVYQVEIEATDRSRTADGRYTVFRSVVEVEAPNDAAALLVAAQIAAATIPDGMVLATTLVL